VSGYGENRRRGTEIDSHSLSITPERILQCVTDGYLGKGKVMLGKGVLVRYWRYKYLQRRVPPVVAAKAERPEVAKKGRGR
jgi:hypothetical protein